MWFLALSVFFICIFTPCLIFFILFYQYRIVLGNNPNLRLERNIETFIKSFDEKQSRIKDGRSYDLKTDIHRKGLHLFPAGIIILLWIFAVYVWEGVWQANEIWGISGVYFGIRTLNISELFKSSFLLKEILSLMGISAPEKM